MARFAIGDVHGCRRTLERLLERLPLGAGDRLWFVGDLVNRGRDSLGVLRLVRALGDRAQCVLGNHDLRLIRMGLAGERDDPRGLLSAVLRAPDRTDWIEWLRGLPLVHREAGWCLVHAGLLPVWDWDAAIAAARLAEQTLQGPAGPQLLEKHRDPDVARAGGERPLLRAAQALAAFTRLRTCTADGAAAPGFDGHPSQAPADQLPWFDHPQRRTAGAAIVFGHWSNLGWHRGAGVLAIDTACVRGGRLTAVDLDGDLIVSEPCDPRDRIDAV